MLSCISWLHDMPFPALEPFFPLLKELQQGGGGGRKNPLSLMNGIEIPGQVKAANIYFLNQV